MAWQKTTVWGNQQKHLYIYTMKGTKQPSLKGIQDVTN